MDQVKFGPELISRLLDYLCSELHGCLGVGLNVWSTSGFSTTLKARGVAEERDERAYDVVVEHGGLERQVCLDDFEGTGFVAVPGSWGDDGPVVLTVYLDHSPDAKDLEVIEDVEPILTMAAAVVEFCAGEVLRADQMVAMVQHRRVIEQAKGLVMGLRRCAAGDAFQLLAKTSQHANVKLRDLSSALVLLVCGTLDETDVTPIEEPGAEIREVARRMWSALQDG